MSARVEKLARWLVERGFAEERSGYGHVDGERLAEALLDSDWAATAEAIGADEFAAWLIDNGYAEERRGFGHIDGERLAEELLAHQRRWRRPVGEN